ncbi:MAG: hypothetical protein IKV53_07445 [Clostridia bacterium]|nr:hypothetical protein [Clostridia bacterium]
MKRILCMLMALLMLVSSMTLLFSCKKEEENESKTEQGGQAVDDGSIFYERSLVSDNLPEKDYGGRKFRIVTHIKDEVEVKEEDRNQGKLLVDAKFARNQAVENRFNVELEVVYSATYLEVGDYVSKTVLSGSDEFDLLLGMSINTGSMVTKKLFLNWYDIEHVDFSKPWWADSTVNELTVADKCPIAISDLNFTAITSTYCMLFNKDLAASYELGNIYKLVLDGKWTFDKLQEMVKDIYVDDGNDIRDENDFYGFYHDHGSCLNTYLWSFDNPICKKDADGIPQIVVKTDKIDSIVSGLYDFLNNTNGVYYNTQYYNEKGISYKRFLERKSIFCTSGLSSPTGEGLRDFEDDYGILPYPKYDESQEKYMTMADGIHTVLAVPKTVKDTEFVGIITEALSAETWKTVTPTLYEIALKTRYLRDSESKEVMDLVIDGRAFDFGYVYGGSQGFTFMLQSMMADGKSNFSSYYDSRYKMARTQYKSIVKAFEKI